MKFKRDGNELEMRYLAPDEEIDTVNPWNDYHKLPLTDSYVWRISNNLNIEVRDEAGLVKYVGKTTNQLSLKINSFYTINVTDSSLPAHAFLLNAPNSNTFGCKEPRAYLDVDSLTNYSTYNTNGKESQDYIKTNFSKVRIISIRNKKHEMVDKIDLADFRFASGNKKFKIDSNNQNKIFVDAAPFGVAMNNNIHHQS